MSGSIQDTTDSRETGVRDYASRHDLGAPLAVVEGFRQALLSSRSSDGEGDSNAYFAPLASAGRQMALLIEKLQTLSWVMESELHVEAVNLGNIARTIINRLRKTHSERTVSYSSAKGIIVKGDRRLLRVLMANLLENAWRFTAAHAQATIEVGVSEHEGKSVVYVRDDGTGFDMGQSDRLFGLFQRLQAPTEVEGDGVGLAIVRQVVSRHGGSVWAEGEVEKGATFHFTL
jgi:light-regulated signal transduction histidine kinase (bacteriophytochrome)